MASFPNRCQLGTSRIKGFDIMILALTNEHFKPIWIEDE